MPACIFAEIMWFCTCRLEDIRYRGVISVALFVIGIIIANNDIGYFGRFNNALVAQAYIYAGYVFCVYERNIKERFNSKLIVLLCMIYLAMVAAIIEFMPGKYMDVQLNMYYGMPLMSIGMIVIGCYVMMIIFMKYELSNKYLEFVGRNTLVFYMLHGLAYSVLVKFCKFFGMASYPATWFGALIKVIMEPKN